MTFFGALLGRRNAAALHVPAAARSTALGGVRTRREELLKEVKKARTAVNRMERLDRFEQSKNERSEYPLGAPSSLPMNGRKYNPAHEFVTGTKTS